jgi:hypothetical protein
MPRTLGAGRSRRSRSLHSSFRQAAPPRRPVRTGSPAGPRCRPAGDRHRRARVECRRWTVSATLRRPRPARRTASIRPCPPPVRQACPARAAGPRPAGAASHLTAIGKQFARNQDKARLHQPTGTAQRTGATQRRCAAGPQDLRRMGRRQQARPAGLLASINDSFAAPNRAVCATSVGRSRALGALTRTIAMRRQGSSEVGYPASAW